MRKDVIFLVATFVAIATTGFSRQASAAGLFRAGPDDCCDVDCGTADCGCDDLLGADLLGGLLKPSEACFGEFISPMTNPVFFEDPRTLTEARFIYIHHRIPTLTAGFDTDNVDVFALQLRVALSERLSLIATKDGYLLSDSPLIDDGWADIAAGLKYNLIRAPEVPFLLSGVATFELPTGSTRSLQGNGDGEFNLALTGMTEFAGFHWISATGLRLPTDTSAENQVWYWSNHLDRRLVGGLYSFIELNWYHWMRSGNALALPIEGGDLFNLGGLAD